jgi:hypothetical protein
LAITAEPSNVFGAMSMPTSFKTLSGITPLALRSASNSLTAFALPT